VIDKRRAFILISGLAFAVCFLLSELGTVRHLPWLIGWPPLLFVFTVPSEYRWRFARDNWVREVFIAMTQASFIALTVSTVVAVLMARRSGAHAVNGSDLATLCALIVIGSTLFGVASLVSAWGLYKAFYRPRGPGRASLPWRHRPG